MPLTALLSGALVDVSSCSDACWSSLHRSRPRASLKCRACGASLHAKVSMRGLRFFAHDRVSESCPTNGETAEHRALKAALADLIRRSGGRANIEATPGPHDSARWRADVLAVGPRGHRVAFEVQLSTMTVTEGWERTQRYAADGIQTVWVTTRAAQWLYALPGVLVSRDEHRLLVRGGIAELGDDGRWHVAKDVPLEVHMPCWLGGEFGYVTGASLLEEGAGQWFTRADAVICASVNAVQIWRERERQRREAEQAAASERAAHEEHVRSLHDRQERLLQTVAEQLASQIAQDQRVWLGVPPSRWDGNKPIPLHDALGNEKTGRGCVLWTGTQRDDLSLRAVLCPVANAVDAGLGRSWRRRGVAVFVETDHEADRVARALGWNASDLTITTGPALSPPPTVVHSALNPEQRATSQQRLLQVVVPRLAERVGGSQHVFLGVPQTRWNGRLPVRLAQARGDGRRGHSNIMWVWTGDSRATLSLHTVVSPNPAVIGPKSGARWRERGVHVVVEDWQEGSAIASKLRWDLADITVIDSADLASRL